MIRIEQVVFDFISKRWDQKSPLLLGCSGGPDSLALFNALLECKKGIPFTLAVAHIDHAWREESGREAEKLQEYMSEHHVTFHLRKLCPAEIRGNLEAGCRDERLKYFSQLCREFGYQAVLLAHHADDKAETILKRVFEGASLCHIDSLTDETVIEGMNIWRPLLEIPKKHLNSLLVGLNFSAIQDSTNLDPKFLRGKLRSRIIPHLSKEFGKEITHGLCQLGKEAAEFKNYLDELVAPYLAKTVRSPIGLMGDFSGGLPKKHLEVKHLIRRFCEEGRVVLSRDILEASAKKLMNGDANARFVMEKSEIYIDRNCLFILFPKKGQKRVSITSTAIKDVKYWNNWKIEVERTNETPSYSKSNWKDLWHKGAAEALLSEEDYEFGTIGEWNSFDGKKRLDKLWTNCKVPAFLRSEVPVIWNKGEMVHEFLSGKIVKGKKSTSPWVKLVLKKVEGESLI